MTYKGHVENGAIVLDDRVELPDGVLVTIELAGDSAKEDGGSAPSFVERYAAVIGKARGLPADAAENHDHYLYGTPKK